MSKMSLRQRWKQTTLANQLMVVCSGIMACATIFLVVAGTLQYLAAREQLQAVREQGNIMQRQLDAFRESSSQTTNQTNDLITATRETANASQSVAKQNEELVKHAGEQAAASQTQAKASIAQAEAAKQSVGAAQITARAAEQSATTAKLSFDIGERPYIVFKTATIPELIPDQPISPTVRLANAGRTPAQDINFSITITAGGLYPFGFPKPESRPVSGLFMAAGEEINLTGAVADAVSFGKVAIEQINSGVILLYVHGEGSYKDINGKEYPINYCLFYSHIHKSFGQCYPEMYNANRKK